MLGLIYAGGLNDKMEKKYCKDEKEDDESTSKCEKKESLYERIRAVIYFLIIVGLIFCFFLIAVGKDVGILIGNWIDNTIGIIALLFGIYSIPEVKKILEKKFKGTRIEKTAACFIITIAIALIIERSDLINNISNICGVVGIIISIYFYWKN